MRVLAAINQKGGVGKTTTTANLGAAIAARGRDICLVDLDPQSHLTLHFNLELGEEQPSTYDVLTSRVSLTSAAVKARDHLWVAPAVIDLAAVEIELANTAGREQLLRRSFGGDWPFEFMLIDCPPSLGLLTVNALAAADDVLIPLQPHFLALQGLGRLLETISLVQHHINPDLRVGGVILCMYEQTTRLAGEVVADLQTFFREARSTNTPWADARIFQAVVRRNIKLAECPSYGQTIFEYAPSSNGARDYNALADEFILWADGLAPRPPVRVEEAQTAVEPAAEAQVAPAATVPRHGEPSKPSEEQAVVEEPGSPDVPAGEKPSPRPTGAAEPSETDQADEALASGPGGPLAAAAEPDPLQAVHEGAVEELLEGTSEYDADEAPLLEDAGAYLPDEAEPTSTSEAPAPADSHPPNPEGKPPQA